MKPAKSPCFKRLNLFLVIAYVGMTLLTACATSKPTPKESVRYGKTEGVIAMEADPFTQTDRLEAIFGEDLWAMSILPIQITVRNNGDNPIHVEARNLKLTLPHAEVITPHSAADVNKWLASQGGMLGKVGMGVGQIGIGQIGHFAGPFGGVASAILSGLYGMYQSNSSKSRDAAYTQTEFKDTTLEKNQFNRGLIYFMIPQGTSAFNEATLSLRTFDNQTETAHIDLPLTSLTYKGKAKE